MSKPASSILVLLNFTEEEPNMEQIIGEGKILWSGHGGFEWIGKGNQDWDSIYLIKYRNHSLYYSALERLRIEEFKQIELYAVKPIASTKIRILRFLMKNVFSRSSVSFSKTEINLDDIPQSEILPSTEQHIRLANEYKGHPIVMLNLLKFNERPSYPFEFEGEKSTTGEDAYNRYGKFAMRAVAMLGGIIVHAGEIEKILIGDQDVEWNQFALMQYPSHTALQSMFRIKESPEAGIQRDAGLEATKVYATTPD
ncbi:MAG: hypothetical protein ACTSV2_16480 [Candidatus Thorarchaeota archaeon]